MRITIFTIGTRGDIQPFIPLAKALQQAGHTLRLVCGSNFRDLVERAGIEFAPTDLDYKEILLSPEIQTEMEKGGANLLLVMLKLFPRVFEMIERALVHAWLFPRMAFIVHHGGGGTTAAALRSGVPSMAIPYAADQPFWGRRAHALGIGPAPVRYKDVTAEKLAAAIRAALSDPGMRATAKVVGEQVRAEDGVGRAVELIQKVWNDRRAH
jgi:UDP:flavonoid glycosyltransferase YjiC (YdhE family)